MNGATSIACGKIVCIGWGSLIWDDRRPFPTIGTWQHDGPDLPLEFARQSGRNRITLVIVDTENYVTTLWIQVDAASLEDAVAALAVREDVPNSNAIGRWPNSGGSAYPHQKKIAKWATARGFSGVVWTALPEGMKQTRHVMPRLTEVKAHLASLSGVELAGALEYIHRAPVQISTPYRPELENSFPYTVGNGERI